MTNRNEIRELIRINNRRLQKLKEQKAIYGIDTPPQILIEIEDIESRIEQLEENLSTPNAIYTSENSEIFSLETLIDMGSFINNLKDAGWKKIHSGKHSDIEFDLIGSRMFTFTKWHVLVDHLTYFNVQTALKWQKVFNDISKASKSFVWGKCFILCLIVEDVSPEAISTLENDEMGLFGFIRMKGGGGVMLVADLENKQIYGEVPSFPPYDVHKFSKDMKRILESVI